MYMQCIFFWGVSANHESISISSYTVIGFAPRLTPATRFPVEYRAWDVLADKMPQLLSSGRLRKYCDEELPELSGEALPPAYAMRACLILGYTAHSIWNLGGLETPDSLSPSIEKPWRAVSKVLGRDTPVMGFFDLMLYNFEFKPGVEVPPLPSHMEPCEFLFFIYFFLICLVIHSADCIIYPQYI